ncbi:hypothetical protein [Arcobacter sp. F2176]|uniref:hypothetical protein n=1 Tax=Arcobacter sp. F2176 TaxID=2044511 RepID=UPI00100AF469|nr:hypothetical protein [Arcobacter sp. F2176]RXJ81165.1 hypothetical protein CRU95_08110 [Arcobacter sp. F2176]
MKKILFSSLLLVNIVLAKNEIKSYIGYEYKSYLKTKGDTRNYNSAITFQNEFKHSFEDSYLYSKISILKDSSEEQRDYFNISELYYSKAFENFDLNLGKKIIFLGSLEANNIVNIFNRQNYQKDSLSTYKKGSIMANLNYFFDDDSTLKLYIKSFEENIKLPSTNSPYSPFKTNIYSKKINFSNKREQPSFLAVYSKSYDDEIIADINMGFFYGYDENILYQKTNNKINPYLFQSAKLFTYDTFVLNSTLYKVEASYTKVQKDGEFDIKDFYNIGVGSEYTIEQIYKNNSLGLIAEYYKSDNKNTSFDNDLFLALRYSLNDKDSSEFLTGIIKDTKKSDMSAYIKYSGRLIDNLNVSADIRYLKSDNYIGEHLRFGCEIKYYF